MGIDQSKVNNYKFQRPTVPQDRGFYWQVRKESERYIEFVGIVRPPPPFFLYLFNVLLPVLDYCVDNALPIHISSKKFPQMDGWYKFDAHRSNGDYHSGWTIALVELHSAKHLYLSRDCFLLVVPQGEVLLQITSKKIALGPSQRPLDAYYFEIPSNEIEDNMKFKRPIVNVRKFGRDVSQYDPVWGPDIVCDFLGDVYW